MASSWILQGLAIAAFAALAGALWQALRRLAKERAARFGDRAAVRKRLERASQERNRWLSIFDAVAEGVLVLDSAGRVTAANRAVRDLLGIEGDPLGRLVLEVARSAEIEAAVRRAQDQGQAKVEFRIGSDQRILTFACATYGPEGEGEGGSSARGTVGVLRDVSVERLGERVRRDFVANVSHEFRTPLTAIRGFAETLEDSQVPVARRTEFAATIVRHSRRLEELVEDLLTLSEIEAGQRSLELQDVDLSILSSACVTRAQPRFEGAGVHITLQLEEGAPLARADPRALEPALENLLENALKYTPRGGSVEISLRGEGSQVALSVSDTGIGIPARDLPRIFERFYRVDRARSRAPGAGGSGVGLSLVKHLVELQGGQVTAQSEREHGSTFEIRLPRA